MDSSKGTEVKNGMSNVLNGWKKDRWISVVGMKDSASWLLLNGLVLGLSEAFIVSTFTAVVL